VIRSGESMLSSRDIMDMLLARPARRAKPPGF
jgi:hypothetical protein